jgi:pimeloyl-ACP methyl ester carboxylesterase
MSPIKKLLSLTVGILLSLYIIVCGMIYYSQEKFIFFPSGLAKDFRFEFVDSFEEISYTTNDQVILNALLFKADSSKGIVFYLHGNAGSLKYWGRLAEAYTSLRHDVLMIDYRGYGKSGGKITSEAQFMKDLQFIYDNIKKDYEENRIVVLGYSIGTCPAARIAAENHPRLLILQAPYYSLTDMMQKNYPVIPTFILEYKFETFAYLEKCTMPVIIFHGDEDNVIPYASSLALKKHLKPTDRLITLKGQGHNGMTANPEYRNLMKFVLDGPGPFTKN